MDEVFGRYRLRELLGAGGMGQVFRAYDTELQRELAIKVLAPQVGAEPAFEERFRREARTAAALGEPHVVPIFDSGVIDGRLFIAMQLIAGTDVAALLRRDGAIPARRAVQIIAQAGAALDAAHAAGLVHRDIKPANLMVTADDFVYLIDFGIARAPGELTLTATGATIGTLAYMAPERFTTSRADKCSDIYALTCVLYECLTGAPPYPAGSVEQQMFAHVAGPPPAPSRDRAGVPPALDAVIARGMAQDPEERYSSAGALAAAARAALGAPASLDQAVGVAADATREAGVWNGPVSDGRVTTGAEAVTMAVDGGQRSGGRPRRTRRGWSVALAAVGIVGALVGGGAYAINHQGVTHRVAVIDTIDVGKFPTGVAVDTATHSVYVTNSDDGTVSVVDADTHAVTDTVAVGGSPGRVAVAPHHLYVTNSDDGTVSVIDAVTHAVTATVRVGTRPTGVAVDPTTRTVYVANMNDGTVSVLDAATHAVAATVNGRRPFGVAVDPATRSVYVTNLDAGYVTNLNAGTVLVLDTGTNAVTATVGVGKAPGAVAVDSAARAVYVTNFEDGTVSVIDAATRAVTATVSVGKAPESIAVDSGTRTVYVTHSEDDTVSVLDAVTRQVTATVRVGTRPAGIAVDPATHAVYVANAGDGTVSVLTATR